MKKKLILIGAGGFAKSIIDSIDKDKFDLKGFIDTYKTGEHRDINILSNSLEKISEAKRYSYFIAIGNPDVRSLFMHQLKEMDLDVANIIDSTSIIAKDAILGNGIYIGKMSIINPDTKLGDGVVVNTRSLVEHGCEVGYCSNISTNVVMNGDVVIGSRSFIGSCAVINGQLTVGNDSIIGSGSVVIRNVRSNVVVAGTPAHFIRDNIYE